MNVASDARGGSGGDVQRQSAIGALSDDEHAPASPCERLVHKAIVWVPELDPDGPRLTDYLLRTHDDLRAFVRIAEELFGIPNGAMLAATRPKRVRQVRQVVLYLMRRWSMFTHGECGLFVETINATEHSSYCYQRVRRHLAEGDLATVWMVSTLATAARRDLKGNT